MATVKIKKVAAFPFAAQLKTNSATIPCQVVKANFTGIMVEIGPSLNLGERCEISFELPVVRHTVTEGVIVMKIYNQFGGAGGTGGNMIRIVELHFRSLTDGGRAALTDFAHKLKVRPE